MQSHSKAQIFIHFVWTTRERLPLLEAQDVERGVHRAINAKSRRLGCVVLALNGTADHVHLLVQMPTKLAMADLAQGVKGWSSRTGNRILGADGPFQWQEGYGAFSVSRSHLPKVIRYVRNQKKHHAMGSIWPSLEESDGELEVRSSSRQSLKCPSS